MFVELDVIADPLADAQEFAAVELQADAQGMKPVELPFEALQLRADGDQPHDPGTRRDDRPLRAAGWMSG
jgi:hypothetical protein